MVNSYSGFILLPGKSTSLLVYVYNMHPLFEMGNNSQNYVYFNQIFTVVVICKGMQAVKLCSKVLQFLTVGAG